MSSLSLMTNTISVFFSYAHEDESLRNELEKRLSILRYQGLITEWYDRNIQAGMEWEHEIDRHLNTSQIILLLVSPDFLASQYCYSIEMQRAMELHRTGEARVIPIILRPADWETTPFSYLQVLPTDALPITSWPDRDAALLNVTKGIRKAVEELNAQQALLQSSSLNSVLNTVEETVLVFSSQYVPFQRNPFFTGREAILKYLRILL